MKNYIYIIACLLTATFMIGMSACQSSIDGSYFPGLANMTYDGTTSTFSFPGSGKGASLHFQHQIRGENVVCENEGSYTLKFPGEYTVSYYKGRKQKGESITFYHGHNDAADAIYTYNSPNAALGSDIFGTLNDGLQGTTDHGDGQWLVWNKEDLNLLIDLGARIMVSRLEFRYYEAPDKKIYPPKSIHIEGSYDNVNFSSIRMKKNITGDNSYFVNEVTPVNNDFRYYRFTIENYLNNGLQKDQDAFLLIDEVKVVKSKN